VSLDTDLPDFTEVMFGVRRSYYEKNDSEEYIRTYFEEKSTVGEWRKPRNIQVPHSKFNDSLREVLAVSKRAGVGGDLDRIDDDIVTSFTVPVIQSNPAFGEHNVNLSGKATSSTGKSRLVRASARQRYPIK